LLPLLLAGVLASGLAAGAWPAFVLSAFRPANTLRGQTGGTWTGMIRNVLVALQFAMLMTLGIAAAVVWQQRSYATHEALKADTANVLVVRTNPPDQRRVTNMQSPLACPAGFRNAVRRLPGVRDVRCTDQAFFRANNAIAWFDKNRALKSMATTQIDPGIFQLYGIHPLAGTLADSSGAVVNLSAAKLLGFSSPQAALGRSWIPADMPPDGPSDTWRQRNEPHSRIAAVVPDFAFTPVTNEIRPTAFSGWLQGLPPRAIHIRLTGADVTQTLAAIDHA
jgi:putative ABC transport system permease protein